MHRLRGESGELECTGCAFDDFFDRATTPEGGTWDAALVELLALQPLLQFESEGGRLEPGCLLSAYPPFIAKESARGVSLRAVPMLERIGFLADLARQLRDVPDGGQVELGVRPEPS